VALAPLPRSPVIRRHSEPVTSSAVVLKHWPAKRKLPRAVTNRGTSSNGESDRTTTPASSTLSDLLDSPEVADLISELDDLRWTGRRGYGARALVGACLVKSLYAIRRGSRTAALIAEHAALRDTLGAAPSVYACYRFAAKLRAHRPLLDASLSRPVAALRAELPEYGVDVAIDASDIPAYAIPPS
jgi:hypothetical protein